MAGAVEALDRRLVVGAVDPAVAGTELELGEARLPLDDVERAVELVNVDAVHDARWAGYF